MILITGASGFVGKHLVGSLKDKPVILVDRHHGYDLTDVTTLLPLLNRKIETVVHLASAIPTNAYSKEYFRINVTGTINLLKCLDKRHIKKIILLSSVSVYKINKDTDTYFREDSDITTSDESSYGYSKYIQESLIKEYCSECSIECLIFRASSIYGRGMPQTLVSVFNNSSKMDENLDITIKNYKQNFVYVVDLVNLIKQGIYSHITGIYNIFSNETFDIEQLAEMVIKVNNSSSKIIRSYKFIKSNIFYDNTKLNKDFNFKFTPLEEGIKTL